MKKRIESHKESKMRDNITHLLMMIAIFVAASALGFIFRYVNFPDTNVVVVYLLAVLIIARLTHSFVFGFAASVLATFAYNYFFADPYFTFSVSDQSYITTFITMTITALVTSTLTLHAQQSEMVARQKESETKSIYELANRLPDAKDMRDIASLSVSNISECFSCEAACLCFDEAGLPEPVFVQQAGKEEKIMREVGDAEEIKRRVDWLRTDYNIGEEFCDWPILGRESILGLIRIPINRMQTMTDAQTRLLRAMIESIALAMDRFRSSEQRIALREETEHERYRANLLRAISHDLRTPLSAIIGTSEMLKGMTEGDDPRHSLMDDIYSEANWLHSLVENILNLTRLRDGRLMLKKQAEAVEEIIDGAVYRITQRSPEYKVVVNIPDEPLFVPMDAKLIEQVFINLLDNAVSHSTRGSEIQIIAVPEGQVVKFTVRDEGTGIKETDLAHLFQMFYTTRANHSDSGHGIGLGLAICDTIIKAHGGDITAQNRKDGNGAEFVFTLPVGGEAESGQF